MVLKEKILCLHGTVLKPTAISEWDGQGKQNKSLVYNGGLLDFPVLVPFFLIRPEKKM